ncbi:FAD-dependent oxidoreductase [Paenibacillus sedimenti]|uniref:NADH:ubiquinone reductase (non-electrogenic) n=1 Tax=Paenibacillus sedimenti TaxID=2770274 RepID=A0A926QHV1_9BACL|nr:FAD-dependent oxidoreductase [Paenibacillus sedimenti]MBD0379931.1 FAD-dependent oxidoreductase [Paenibacillus sedimenti]
MTKPAKVLILGGGYLAINAVRTLRQAIHKGDIEVTVVSRENYHVFHGFVTEMVTGRIGAGQILSPIRRIFSPAQVHVGEIEQIYLAERKVVTSRHLDGKHFELEFDHVVLCLGSVDNLSSYPGLAEHAFKLKTYDDCFRLKNHILTMFELADIERDPKERKRMLTFFVAGGGFSGTELAGELADYIRLLTLKEYRNIQREECRVVLVHPGESILPELYGGKGAPGTRQGHPRLIQYATRHMAKLGVELMTNTRVIWATPNEVGLSNGMRIPAKTIISAVGTKPSPILDSLAVPKDARGKIITDSALQVAGYDYVWAGGDCASVPHPLGGQCPPVGIFALKEGAHIGKNIVRALSKQPSLPFNFRGFGQGVSIGRRTAVAEYKGIEFKGFICWLIWRLMLLSVIPTWDRKLRLISDWLIGPLVGRDIVEMSVNDSDDYEISHHVFQPGEVIVTEGSIGNYVFVISDGEVEKYTNKKGTEKWMGSLGKGACFGHTQKGQRVTESIRAKTTVQAVSVRSDQAHRLHHLLSSLGRNTERKDEKETG